jgi:long-chain fatty acid transport protein
MNSSKGFWLASVAAVSLIAATGAQAGGFINQSQSTVFNGMGYAGYAAPGTSPSAMFLNPATMTEFRRFTTENNFSGVFPVTKITGTGATGSSTPSGDIGQDALVPASYFIMPLNESLSVGLSINSPFGLTTKPDLPWGGQLNSTTTKARTYTFTPSVAYKLSDSLSLGFGIQAQYFSATFLSDYTVSVPNTAVNNAGVKGDGWGYGVTAGLTWKPMAGTAIGIGYRSRIDQKIEGNYVFSGGSLAAYNNSPISGTLKLPDRLNLSIRQMITPEWDVLGSVEWHNWSRIGTAPLSGPDVPYVSDPSRYPSLGSIKFNYKDAWFFAIGSEYKWSKDLTVRGGVAYELSPVTTEVRTTRLPDNNRLWLSTGASYKLTELFTMNASYSRVMVKDANISIASPAYTGQSKAHVDILSLGLMTRW